MGLTEHGDIPCVASYNRKEIPQTDLQHANRGEFEQATETQAQSKRNQQPEPSQ